MNSLRVSHLSFHDHTGAGRSAARLCEGLQDIGLDSRLHVHEKWTGADFATRPDSLFYELRARTLGRLDRAVTRCAAAGGPAPSIFSHNRFSLWSHRWQELSGSHVVHLHWIGWSFLALEELSRIRQPVIWTLHDSWPFTGGCHLPADCRRFQERCGCCPQLHSTRKDDLSFRVWKRKFRNFQEMDLSIVAPSRWMANLARTSSLLEGASIEVIPNAIDTQTFRPMLRERARKILGLPSCAFLILFGAIGGVTDQNKGADILADALRLVSAKHRKDEIVVLLFGGGGPVPPGLFPVRHLHLGMIADNERLRTLYSAADITVVPSRSENLPNVVLESMACGTVCTGFEIGGLPDMIDHGENGFLAKPFHPGSLAEGILWAVEGRALSQLRSDSACRKIAAQFAKEKVARRHLAAYEKILASHPYRPK